MQLRGVQDRVVNHDATLSFVSMITELEFDPMAPAFSASPHPILRRFRERSPVHFWKQRKGWVVFRYRDFQTLMREPRLIHDPNLGRGLSSELRASFPDYAELQDHSLFTLASADHARIRRLINPFFAPKALRGHRVHFEQIIRERLEQLPRSGVIDVARDFSRHFPVRVIAALLNIPPRHDAEFVAFADALIATMLPSMEPDVFASYMPAVSAGATIIRGLIADRRQHPVPDDLFSQLIHACDHDERLSDGELFSLVSNLLIGGSDTTVSLTTHAILELLRHPDQLAHLRAAPHLASSAVDETLRYNGIDRSGLIRFAAETFEYEGVTFLRGQPVFIQTLSAFRDPEFVSDADTYDINRTLNMSPRFGWGAHYCIGASLARMEVAIALELFFERYPRVALAGEPVYGDHPVLRDLISLPVRVG